MATLNQGFMWGAGTCAHQVEGGTYNSWTNWELENASALSKQASYRYDELEQWNQFKAEAEQPENYICGDAAQFYVRYERDIAAAGKMGLNSLRISIEWSRVQPTESSWDAEAVRHYKKMLMACESYGITPVVVFFHITAPQWFITKGGFTKRSNNRLFVAYCERMTSEFGRHARFILTMYEPDIYASQSYLHGEWPPAVQSKKLFLRVYFNLIAAHRSAYTVLKRAHPSYQIAAAKQTSYFYPGDTARLTHLSATLFQFFNDDIFLKLTYRKADFMAITYSESHRVYGYRVHDREDSISDTGAHLAPGDIEYALNRLWDIYKQPLFVVGGGMADRGTQNKLTQDNRRVEWLKHTISGLQRAHDGGVSLLGYLYGSLLDGFEWEKGYWPKYGLIAVDKVSKTRTPKISALWYVRFLKQQTK